MRGRGTLLIMLAVLSIATSAYALERAPRQAPYTGPLARPFTETHEVYPQVAFLGDSYIGGSNQGGNGANGWPALVSDAHRWSPHLFAVGGSGYLVKGSGDTTFGQRLPDIEQRQPQMLVIWGSRNDTGDPTQVGVALADILTRAKRDLPRTKLLVIGPVWVNATPPANIINNRYAERSAAAAADVPFVDPLAEGWFTGEASTLIGSDHVHPTNQGHRYLASLIDAKLKQYGLTSLPKPPQQIESS